MTDDKDPDYWVCLHPGTKPTPHDMSEDTVEGFALLSDQGRATSMNPKYWYETRAQAERMLAAFQSQGVLSSTVKVQPWRIKKTHELVYEVRRTDVPRDNRGEFPLLGTYRTKKDAEDMAGAMRNRELGTYQVIGTRVPLDRIKPTTWQGDAVWRRKTRRERRRNVR